MSTLRVCETCAAIFDEPIEECPRDGTPLEDGADKRIGTTIGRYVLVRRIGKGVRGYVYLGVHPVIRSRVAIKILHNPADEDSDAYKRFVIEAQAVNEIQHPNIIRVMDMAVLPDKRPYILMEYVEGSSLRELMLEGSLQPDDAYDVVQQVLAGLQAAHDADFIHRDLKPRNIFVTAEGEAKILDFGIAKLIRRDWTPITRTGMILGTPMYIAPEQALGKNELVGPWTDLYSAGIILYELFTGAQPFDAQTSSAILVSHINSPPVRPSERYPGILPALEGLILWCLEKDPVDRPQSCQELSESLHAAWHEGSGQIVDALGGSPLPAIDATVDQSFDVPLDASGQFPVRGDPTDPSYRFRSPAGDPGRPSGSLNINEIMRGSGRTNRGRRGRRWLWAGLALILAVGAALGGLWWVRQAPRSQAPLTAGGTGAVRANQRASSPPVADTDTLRVVQSRGVSTLDPCRAVHPSAVTPIQQIHEALVRYDNLTGQVQPWLARTWKRKGRSLTFELRDDVRFHDGVPLTAKHVAASLRRAIASPLGKGFLWDVGTITVRGPHKIRIHLRHRSVTLLMRLALWPAFVTRPGPSHPLGTGPFRVQTWNPQAGTLTLIPHRRYWGAVPRVGRVVFTPRPDPDAQATLIRQGKAHLLTDVPAALAARLQRERTVQVLRSSGQSMVYLHYNTRRPYLRSPEIRRALSMAINRDRFVKRLYEGSARRARTSVPSGFSHSIRGSSWPKHDPVQAAALLAGKPVTRRRLLLYLTEHAKFILPNPKLAAKLIVHDLAAVGVQVNAVFVPAPKLNRALRRGDHDLTYAGWRPDYPDPENIYFLVSRRGLNAGVNRSHYQNAALERLLQAARGEQSGSKRQALFGRIERHLARQLPWLPMAQLPTFVVHRAEVAGLAFDRSLNVSLSLRGIRLKR